MRKLLFLAAMCMLATLAWGATALAQADRDCKDFPSQAAAQSYFDANGGSAANNFDNLDANRNGMACEDYDYGGGSSIPVTTTAPIATTAPITTPMATTAPITIATSATTTPAETTAPVATTSTSSALPDTGGPVLLLPATALLVGSGLLALRLRRRNS